MSAAGSAIPATARSRRGSPARLPDPRVQRRPDLSVADPARALDGKLRVRHLRLCLDLVSMIGDLSDLGFATSAQRFVPEYAKRGAFDLLRGFLSRSRWIAVGSATVIAATGIVTVRLLAPYLAGYLVLPLSIAFATLPFYARRAPAAAHARAGRVRHGARHGAGAAAAAPAPPSADHERALLAPGAQRQGLPRARNLRRQAQGTAPPAPAARGHRAGDVRHHVRMRPTSRPR